MNSCAPQLLIEPTPKPTLLYSRDWDASPSLFDACSQYDEEFGRQGGLHDAFSLAHALRAKETIARTALARYHEASSHSAFIQAVSSDLAPHLGPMNQQAATELTTPVDTRRIAPPAEAILATSKNISVALQYANSASSLAMGTILSGSNAWGSFYAPKLIAKSDSEKPSDVDLLVAAKDTDAIGAIVEQYVEDGLVDGRETERFAQFVTLQRAGKASMFSLRSSTTGTEISAHLLGADMLQQVCSLNGLRSHIRHGRQAISVINDFRPNSPSATKRKSGYTLGILDAPAGQNIRYLPLHEPIFDHHARHLGFIAQSPVGGYTLKDGVTTYTLGVIPTFLTSCPVIVGESNNQLSKLTSHYRSKIADIMGGRIITNIIRQEEMPSHSLRSVIESLSFSNNYIEGDKIVA